jgi:hypothetical protein
MMHLPTRGHELRFERVESPLRVVERAGASRDVFPWVTLSLQSTSNRLERIRLRVR